MLHQHPKSLNLIDLTSETCAVKQNTSQYWDGFHNYYWLDYTPIVNAKWKNSTILWTKTQVIGRKFLWGGLSMPSDCTTTKTRLKPLSFTPTVREGITSIFDRSYQPAASVAAEAVAFCGS